MATKDIRYPLDMFIKYRKVNTVIPNVLQQYLRANKDEISSKHFLQVPEIRAHLNAHMNRKNMTNEDEQLFNKLMSILNKLNNNNYDNSFIELKSLKLSTRKHLYKLAEEVILKGINERKTAGLYAKLCNNLIGFTITVNNNKLVYKTCLWTICQDIFEQLTNTRAVGKQYEYTRSKDYSKLVLSGLMNFIAELYNNDVVPHSVALLHYKCLINGILTNVDYYDGFATYVQGILQRMKKNYINDYNKICADITLLLESNNKQITYDGKKYNYVNDKSANEFKLMDVADYIKTIKD